MKIGWYSELTTVEKRTYWACFGGFALDSMDSTIYSLIVPVLIAVVGITRPEAGVIATAALIGNAIGGWGSGILADRFGRIAMLKITILWVAAFTVLAAASTGFHEFLAVRFLQGIGYGGEAAVGGVLISEAIRPQLRGRVAASVVSGYGVGYAISTALMPIILSSFPAEIGWRVMFAIGILPAFLVLFIRRLVPEGDIFVAAEKARRAGKKSDPFWAIFRSPNLRSTLPGVLLATGIFGGGFAMSTWLPTYLRTDLHLTVTSTAGYLGASILGSLTGPLYNGWISDRIGRRAGFAAFIICEVIVISFFLFAPIGPKTTLALAYCHGALQSGLSAGMLPAFSELFKTNIRASGSGFCVTGGRGFGSIVPATVGILAATMPLGHAMGVCALAALALAFFAALFLPERAGIDLDDENPGPQGVDYSRSRA